VYGGGGKRLEEKKGEAGCENAKRQKIFFFICTGGREGHEGKSQFVKKRKIMDPVSIIR